MPLMTEMTERDWARVRSARCDECGFDPRDFHDRELPAAVRAMGERWVIFVDACGSQRDGDVALCSRSDPGHLSALELACHVRDAVEVATKRLERTLADDRPHLDRWDYEAAFASSRYEGQAPHDVAADIGVFADHFADVMRHATRDRWNRTATLLGREFTVAGLARFVLHEGHHHLIEAERSTQTIGAR
jgi:S-DNA-T family DNA segregation ATPase FtsK/SpoIIIE